MSPQVKELLIYGAVTLVVVIAAINLNDKFVKPMFEKPATT